MASPENCKVFVVNTRDCCVFCCSLGSGLALALSTSAAQENQYQIDVPDRHDWLHGQ
jgi:hypothetical protein